MVEISRDEIIMSYRLKEGNISLPCQVALHDHNQEGNHFHNENNLPGKKLIALKEWA